MKKCKKCGHQESMHQNALQPGFPRRRERKYCLVKKCFCQKFELEEKC